MMKGIRSSPTLPATNHHHRSTQSFRSFSSPTRPSAAMESTINQSIQSLHLSATNAGPISPLQDPKYTNALSSTSSPPPPILYLHTLCPYAERVWITFLEKQIPFHLVHIDLSNKPSWFTQNVNRRGLVPAVGYDNTVYTESMDICSWANNNTTQLNSSLNNNNSMLHSTIPDLESLSTTTNNTTTNTTSNTTTHEQESLKKALRATSSLIDAGLSLCSGSNGRYWGIGSQGPTERQKKEFISQAHNVFSLSTTSMNTTTNTTINTTPFILGTEHPTLADISLYPFMKRYAVICDHIFNSSFDIHSCCDGAVGRWLIAMQERDSCKITTADEELLASAFRKHMSLDFFDYSTYEIFELHPHNKDLLL